MSTVVPFAVAGYRAEAGEPSPAAFIAKPGSRLNFAVVALLSMFAFVLATDLRMADGTSIAMRLGYASLLLGSLGLIKRKSAVVPTFPLWCLLGFVVWSTCTTAWAEFPAAAQHKVLTYWILLAVAAVVPQYAWDFRVRSNLIDSYVAGCWMGVIGTAANFAAGIAYSADGGQEMEGRYTFGTDPNYLALALVLGIPLSLFRSTTANASWHKALCFLYVPAALVGLILTGSRGAAVALVAAVVAYGLFAGRKARVFLGAGAILCVIVAGLLPLQMSERFATIPDELQHGTLSDRRELWDRGTVVAKDHPLEGVGAGASTGMFDIAVHNTPLELAMEGGVVSLAFFYGAFLVGIGRIWRSDRREASAMIAVWAAWLVGTLSLSWEVNTVTWFMLAILFSAGSPRSDHPATTPSRMALERSA